MITAVLDWAASREIGFSHVVSLGDMADVDFGDMLDYLAADPGTRAILLYIEAITHARKFMSAARAAARNKPVLVVKVGRFAEGGPRRPPTRERWLVLTQSTRRHSAAPACCASTRWRSSSMQSRPWP
jgi:succinyl-CoA synthetase alpha subunit